MVVNRRSRTREIVDLIDLDIERKGDVVPNQLEMRMSDQVLNVTPGSGEEIVQAENDSPFRQKTLT